MYNLNVHMIPAWVAPGRIRDAATVMDPLRSAFVLTVVLSQLGTGQARVVSEPPEPSLLNITRQWARASSLGDLRELRAGEGYRELRVWRGYALTGGTDAVVLRRSEGHWSAFRARVLRCEIEVSRAVWDTASRATVQRYTAEARRHCGTPAVDVSPGARVLATDSLVVEALSVPEAMVEDSWSAAVRAGAFELPERVVRDHAVDDRWTYVVELRSGTEYRASMIEDVERPETRADQQIKDVYAAVSRVAKPDQSQKP